MSDIAKMIAIARKFGGGASGTAAPVVILPETVLTVDEGGEEALIMTPFAADLVIDGNYVVTYNGVDYNCIGRLLEMESVSGVILGNTSMFGVPGGNDNAPFLLVQNPPDLVADIGAYGTCVVTDGATSVTLSIVQTAGGAAADSGGNGVMTVRVEASTPKKDMALSGCDKTFVEFQAAYNAGKLIRIIAATEDNGNPVEYVGNVVFYTGSGGIGMFAVAMPYATGTTTKQFLIMAGDSGEAIFTSYDNE